MYLTQSLHRAVQQHPDRPAIRAGALVRSYREFAERVARLAGALQQLGMMPGDRVAMLALNSDRYMEYQFAVPWAAAQ
jgi:acyl-CoA synthetase (AMP-forming)/AMP-acid ligase II